MNIPGYTISESFSESGELISVPAGSGYLASLTTSLLAETVPSGVSVYLTSLTCHAFDIDLSQMMFSLRRNGTPIGQCAKIPGIVFKSGQPFTINELYPPGRYEIVASNLSGTVLPNAIPAVASLCQANWSGHLLVKTKPLSLSGEFFSTGFSRTRNFLK